MVTNQRSSYRRNQAESTETWQSLPTEKTQLFGTLDDPTFVISSLTEYLGYSHPSKRLNNMRRPIREKSHGASHREKNQRIIDLFKGRVLPTEMMMSRAWRVPTLPQSMGAPSYRLPLHQELLGHRGAIEASDWPCSWPHGHDALGAGFCGRKSSRLPSHCQEPHGSSLDRNLKLDPWRFQASPASTTTIAMTRTGASSSMGEPGAGGFSIGNF